MPKHPIVHIEISSKDHEASGKFYHDLFGWQVKQIPEMEYATFESGDGGPGGGFTPISEDFPAGAITFYVNTDDIQDTLTKVETLGGKPLTAPMDIPGVGLFAFFLDPNGNKVALLQPTDMN